MERVMTFSMPCPVSFLRAFLLGSLLNLSPVWAAAGPVDCGQRPISLAYFEFGYQYYEKDGQGHGIDKDLVDELAKRTGCQFSTQSMPRARVWAELASGSLDMSVAGIQNAERDRFAWFAPYERSKNYVVLRLTTVASVHQWADFSAQNALQFGVVRGFKHGDELDQWLDPLRQTQRVQESASVSQLFEKLKHKHIDGLFAQPVVYRKLLQDHQMEDEVALQDWAPQDKGVVGSLILAKSRFSRGEAARWQALMQELKRDGTLARIFRRYVSAEEVSKMLDF
jgi:polar amino acid transport system substrate-binding protein